MGQTLREFIEALDLLLVVISPAELVALALVPSVINQRRPAVSTIAWILALVALPYFGVIFYIFFGASRLRRRVRKRRTANVKLASGLQDVSDALRGRRLGNPGEFDDFHELPRQLGRLARAMGPFPQTTHNHVSVLDGGSQKFPALMAALRQARHHIHLEYYIFEADETGEELRDLLVAKARDGVEVRILWDAVGSYGISMGFFDGLEAVGGRAASFLPARLTGRRMEINFRNHRKIVVIDGRVGFTGGMNVGNEYAGRDTAPWRDVHLQIEGPAVHSLQEIFAEDWFFATGEDLASADYFPRHRMPGDEVVQIVGSGPDQEWPAIHQLIFTAIAMARERVLVMTPYFVPTEPVLMALKTAAQRNVEVRLLLPSRSDQPLAFFAGRSYYQELLQAGVRIYEHAETILHGKMMTVDGVFATVGTANMDERSFQLNFEVNALLHSTPLARRIEAMIQADIDAGSEVTLADVLGRPFHVRLAENACRLLSPML